MVTLARMTFLVSAERLSDFESSYKRILAPLLQRKNLVAAAEEAHPTSPEGFCRLFQVETPAAIRAHNEALQGDPAWRQALQQLSAEYNTILDPQLRIYRCPAGPGRRAGVGDGFRRGLWQSFGVQDHLPLSIIADMLQDRQGKLWCATVGEGVCCYDGAQVIFYTTEDGLAGNSVRALLEDRTGCLWFGTEAGLSCYDGTTFTTYSTTEGLAANSILSIAEDHRGHLWFGTGHWGGRGGRGVSRYDGHKFANFTAAEGLADNIVLSMRVDRQGRLWLGTWDGLSCWDGTEPIGFTRVEGLAGKIVRAIMEDRQGDLWFGTQEDGLYRYNQRGLQRFTEADGLTFNRVMTMAEDRWGRLWVGTYGRGVSRFNGSKFSSYTVEDGLANDQVLAVLADSAGDLWFGTWTGISRYQVGLLDNYTIENGLVNNGVMCLQQDSQGHIWCGTWAGIGRFDGEQFTTFAELNIRAICQDRQGQLWFVGESGAWRYDGDKLEAFSVDEGLTIDDILTIGEDREGRLWFGGTSQNPICFDGEGFADFSFEEEPARYSIMAILADGRGRLWFGTGHQHQADGIGEGVRYYDGQGIAALTVADGLVHNQISAIAEDQRGHLWFGTFAGLCRYDGEQFTTFTTEDGLAHNHVMCIMEDRQGHMWFGTFGGGVSCFDGQVFQHLSRKDGLVHDVVQDIIQDDKGNIWIGTEGGISCYRPATKPPGIRIVDVIADRHYGSVGRVELTVSQKLLAIEFQGYSLSTRTNGMVYTYRLKGLEKGWQTAYKGRVEYVELPLGEYLFQVRAVDRDLNYSEPAEVKVMVEPDARIEGLTDALSHSGSADQFVGDSSTLRHVQQQLAQIAPTDLTVLILGETGTGKGLAARSVHSMSPRRGGPFIQVNCGAIPQGLVESELFGHEKGSFSGAHSRKLGKVELAQDGTLFLDEIGDMPLDAQIKLLQLLEERTFARVGGTQTLNARVRVLAATNRPLDQMVGEGSFREDLYYRMQGFEISLPPLRRRQADIPLLTAYFAAKMGAHLNKPIRGISAPAEEALLAHAWPGNVRELEHAVQRAVVVCAGEMIQLEDLALGGGQSAPANEAAPISLEENERRYLLQILEQTDWVIKGPKGAAALVGKHESTLRNRMKKLGIKRPEKGRIWR